MHLLLLLVRTEDHHHLTAFHLGELLNHRMFLQVSFHTFQKCEPKFLVGNFTATETQGNLGFVAFLQKADQAAQLDLIIAFIRAWSEFDFLDLNLFLLETSLVLTLAFGIFEFAVIHQATDWRLRLRRNLNQINISFFRFCKSLIETHDPQRLAINPHQSNLLCSDVTVDSYFFFLSYRKFSKLIIKRPCINLNLGANVRLEPLYKSAHRHGTKVFTLAGTHSHLSALHFAVTCH